MSNRDKIEMLRQLHEAINDQLIAIIEAGEDYESCENMPLYTIGIGGMTFSFPATIIYRVMFDNLFKGWDELKSDGAAAGIEGANSEADNLEDAFEALSNLMDFDDFDGDVEEHT